MTNPSAPSAYGRVPDADSAPILLNLIKLDAPMLRSMPPVIATSNSCAARPSTAALTAAIADAHAASHVKFGPRKLNRFAILPAMQFDNSPGIVSSVMGG